MRPGFLKFSAVCGSDQQLHGAILRTPPEPSTCKHILVVFLPGLGNAVSLVPFLRELRGRFVKSEITLWCREKVVIDLLSAESLIDKFVLSAKPTSVGWLQCRLAQIRSFLSLRGTRFDVVFFVQLFCLRSLAMRLSIRCEYVVAYATETWYGKLVDAQIDYTEVQYEAYVRMNLLHPWFPGLENQRPTLRISDAERVNAETALGKANRGGMTIGVHPGCSSRLAQKRWPSENFRLLMSELLTRSGIRFVIFGGPDDKEVAEEILNGLSSDRVRSLVSQLSIRATAACIKECDVFISNDSGLMHVAAAVGIPVIALFGKSSVEKNAPPYPDVHVLDGRQGSDLIEPMRNISVDSVVLEVLGFVSLPSPGTQQ